MLPRRRSVALTIFTIALGTAAFAEDSKDVSAIRQVISAVHLCVVEGREKDFLSHYSLPSGFEKPMQAAFQYQRETFALEDALTKRFGDGAIQKFKRIRVAKSFEPTFLPRDTKWVSGVEIVVEKDRAYFQDPHTGLKTTLIRKDGAWKFTMDDMGDLEGTQKLYEDIKKIVTWAREQVEKNEDLQQIKTEMGERYWRVLQGG